MVKLFALLLVLTTSLIMRTLSWTRPWKLRLSWHQLGPLKAHSLNRILPTARLCKSQVEWLLRHAFRKLVCPHRIDQTQNSQEECQHQRRNRNQKCPKVSLISSIPPQLALRPRWRGKDVMDVFKPVSPVLKLGKIQSSGKPQTYWSAYLMERLAFLFEKSMSIIIGDGKEKVKSSHSFF